MNKTRNKRGALKKTANEAGFFRALFFGLIVSVAVWLVVALALSFAVYKQTDSTALVKIFGPVNAAVSLAAGGFAAAKFDKKRPFLVSFVLGCVAVAICYAVSSGFDFSVNASVTVKTLLLLMMILCPLFGARLCCRKKGNKRNGRKRM